VPAGYSGTPLPKKLGIKTGSRVLLVAAPPDFELADLPPGVTIRRRTGREGFDVVLLFCRDLHVLVARLKSLIPAVETAGALWVCWPKRASGVVTNVTESLVRDHGLQTGLVDVKVAAIDEVWSGLKFVRRLADR
jgi:hypothetical protein